MMNKRSFVRPVSAGTHRPFSSSHSSRRFNSGAKKLILILALTLTRVAVNLEEIEGTKGLAENG
jgi:hypothetical protein